MSSADRPNQTVADYVALVLSPALIMGLIGSLVFFLLEVFYRVDGDWKGRLQYILFFFVFGIVLVARISMMGEIADRARYYGPVLALAAYIGLQRFVEYPTGAVRDLSVLVNLVLIGVVWWCAYRLTWDCTNVDEETDMSGEGLLQAAGLEESAGDDPDEEKDEEAKDGKKLTWWQRWQRYREQRNKRRTLGVWVVYFSLAALPLFGLGQSLIPLTSPGRRLFGFWLLMVYVACGLGLLMTTCFLGLRRYLRQRRLQMPAAMTGVWLTTGGGLIVVLLLVGALLPRPYPEYSLYGTGGASAAKRKASDYAMKGGAHGEGPGRDGEARPEGKQGKGEPGKGEKGEPGKGESGEAKGKGESGGDKDKQQGGGDGPKGEKGKADGKDAAAKAAQGMKEGEKSSSSRGRDTLTRLSELTSRVGPILKWLVFAVLVFVVLIYVFRGALQFLANFTDWARRWLEAWRNFWARLFGGQGQQRPADMASAADAEEAERERPFADFASPFASGLADVLPPRELVRYTFAALQAWARQHDLGRHPGEAPGEFADRLGSEVPALEAEVQRLVALYERAAYGRGSMPANATEVVREFWEVLERVAEQPLSA